MLGFVANLGSKYLEMMEAFMGGPGSLGKQSKLHYFSMAKWLRRPTVNRKIPSSTLGGEVFFFFRSRLESSFTFLLDCMYVGMNQPE